MFLLKEVAALLIVDDLRSEGNRSLFKTENIINLSKDFSGRSRPVTDLQLLILLSVLIIVSPKNSFEVFKLMSVRKEAS